jgi:hypothetical protein
MILNEKNLMTHIESIENKISNNKINASAITAIAFGSITGYEKIRQYSYEKYPSIRNEVTFAQAGAASGTTQWTYYSLSIAATGNSFIRFVQNGSALSAGYTMAGTEYVGSTMGDGADGSMIYLTGEARASKTTSYLPGYNVYVCNNTVDPRVWVGEDTHKLTFSTKVSVYNAPGGALTDDCTGFSRLRLIYQLSPRISLNSKYYNFDNVRIKVRNLIVNNWDWPGSTDSYSFVWQEQDINDLSLSFCYYRVRLYDKDTNELIYEDLVDQAFSAYRTINLSDVKIQNNADESINCVFSANSHFQGIESFNDYPIGTYPTGPWTPLYATNFTDANCFVEPGDYLHSKTLYQYQSARPLATDFYVQTYDFGNGITNGNIEFYLKMESNAYTHKQTRIWFTQAYLGTAGMLLYPYQTGLYSYGTGNVTLNATGQYDNIWHHYRLSFNVGSTWSLYIDSYLVASGLAFYPTPTSIRYMRLETLNVGSNYKIDAIDGSWDLDYYIGRNKHVNSSIPSDWNHYPQWNTGYQSVTTAGQIIDSLSNGESIIGKGGWYLNTVGTQFAVGFTSVHGRNQVLGVTGITNSYYLLYNHVDAPVIAYDVSICPTSTSEAIYFKFDQTGMGTYFVFNVDGHLYYRNPSSVWMDAGVYSANVWINLRITYAKGNYLRYYINRILLASYSSGIGNTAAQYCYFYSSAAGANFYVDALSISTEPDYQGCLVYIKNYTAGAIAGADRDVLPSIQINPYSNRLKNFSLGYDYELTDLYGNSLQNGTITPIYNNSIIYTPPNNRELFISLANQRGEYLNWENYQIRVNGTQIYSNLFYYEIDKYANISIWTRFNKYITQTLHRTTRESNYIPITITQFSLKIFNQQSKFIYSNVTFDPNYPLEYCNQYWSEWFAPNEIGKYFLSPGHYRINITEYETNTSTVYAYYLTGDDMLLVNSQNTISNVLMNIINVNSTIGNQINTVSINLTNQNTKINNSIFSIDIHLNNINSTLGTQLLYQSLNMTAIGNNISTLYAYTGTKFTIMQNNINHSFSDINSSIYLMNNSIYTSVQSVSASLTNINNSISGNMSILVQLNGELTDLYRESQFRDYLDWTNASINSTYVKNQLDVVKVINQYRNQSLEYQLKYNGVVETLQMAASESKTKFMPKTNVTYRVKSLRTGEYLTDWKPISNKTIDYGTFEDPAVSNPTLEGVTGVDFLVSLSILLIAIVLSIYYMNKAGSENPYKRKQKSKTDREVQDKSDLKDPINAIRRKRN